MNGSNLPAVIEQSAKAQGLVLANVNLIMPTETFGAVLGEYDKVTIETVRVDTSDEREVYEPNGKGKGYALTKSSLQKIAAALSIQWHPQSGIVESTETRSRAKAIGIMQKPNGETVVQTEEKTIDLNVERDNERAKAEKNAEGGKVVRWEETPSGKSKPIKEPWKDEAEKQRWIELEIENAIKQKRRFKDELALTGAKDRVIRAFLALKSTYTRDELSKPLAFPRVSLDSSKLLRNPELRQEAIDRLPGSVRQIFGPSPLRNVTPDTPQIEAPAEPAAAPPAIVDELDPFGAPATPQPATDVDPRVAELEAKLEEFLADDHYPLGTHAAEVKELLAKETVELPELEDMIKRINTYRTWADQGAAKHSITPAEFVQRVQAAAAKKPQEVAK